MFPQVGNLNYTSPASNMSPARNYGNHGIVYDDLEKQAILQQKMNYNQSLGEQLRNKKSK